MVLHRGCLGLRLLWLILSASEKEYGDDYDADDCETTYGSSDNGADRRTGTLVVIVGGLGGWERAAGGGGIDGACACGHCA